MSDTPKVKIVRKVGKDREGCKKWAGVVAKDEESIKIAICVAVTPYTADKKENPGNTGPGM
jgi:hypothetical protein